MERQPWFSANLRLICLIQGQGATRYQDSVYLFRATDFEAAFTRALALGAAGERAYRNGDDEEVRWRFKEVISLDCVPHEDLDGAEVYSGPVDLEEGVEIPFEATFNPEASEPTHAI
mgnify:CR=1 FL=1